MNASENVSRAGGIGCERGVRKPMREVFGSCCASNFAGRAAIAALKRPMKTRRFTKKIPSAPPAAQGTARELGAKSAAQPNLA
jgi:hypothetical protein